MPPAATDLLSVRIVHGNLRFVGQALMVGHYRSMALTGAERVVDTLVGGAMLRALELGSYPQSLETRRVFPNNQVNKDNPWQMPRPRAAVVVGLGDENEIDGKRLASTVCQGVLAWAERLMETGNPPEPFEMAATLVGSGGSRIGVGQAALLVVDGVRQANLRLARLKQRMTRLHLIELYGDRAAEAWAALYDRAASASGDFTLEDHIHAGVGGLKRPLDAGYRGTDYDLIAATQERQNDAPTLSFIVSTKRARTEVRGNAPQFSMIRDLLAQQDDPNVGRTLFQYLVPTDLKPFLASSSGAVLELDSPTAAIPWELLDPQDGDAVPWAISAKLVRKLRTPEVASHVAGADHEAHALVIGEPECNQDIYGELPRATKEAEDVAQLLKKALGADRVCERIRGPEKPKGWAGKDILRALLDREWQIVHVAGHGDLPAWIKENPSSKDEVGTAPRSQKGPPKGVVLSNGYLGQIEFRQMKRVPELVFINCCYLGKQDLEQLRGESDARDKRYDRLRYAASLAESLIERGVRCVVAAGWDVDDEAARAFATAFYQELTRGKRFMNAVATARETSRSKGGNTWAAYQCYGDPDWSLMQTKDLTLASPEETFAGISSAETLQLALESVAVEAKYDKKSKAILTRNLEYLEGRFAARWSMMGSVAEAFGTAWTDLDSARAIDWFARALQANDGACSMRAAEQLGNLRARAAFDPVLVALEDGAGPGEASVRTAAIEGARQKLAGARELLEGLVEIQPTIERQSLCGSTYKLIARLERLAGDDKAEREAIAAMETRYGAAEKLALESNDPGWFYPAQNCLAAQLTLHASDPAWTGFESGRFEAVVASLKAKNEKNPDFWSAVGLIELRVFEAIAGKRLAGARPSIEKEYDTLKNAVPSPHFWASVRNQLRFVMFRIPEGAERDAALGLLSLLEKFSKDS